MNSSEHVWNNGICGGMVHEFDAAAVASKANDFAESANSPDLTTTDDHLDHRIDIVHDLSSKPPPAKKIKHSDAFSDISSHCSSSTFFSGTDTQESTYLAKASQNEARYTSNLPLLTDETSVLKYEAGTTDLYNNSIDNDLNNHLNDDLNNRLNDGLNTHLNGEGLENGMNGDLNSEGIFNISRVKREVPDSIEDGLTDLTPSITPGLTTGLTPAVTQQDSNTTRTSYAGILLVYLMEAGDSCVNAEESCLPDIIRNSEESASEFLINSGRHVSSVLHL